MELNTLYAIANKEKIYITNFKMHNKAIIAKVDKKYCIGLNYEKINSFREEKELLAEEIGHYYCNALYNCNSNINTIRRKEYKANKWKCLTLVPLNSLNNSISKGLNSFYEIAEDLGVNEETVKFAYNYYLENGYFVNNL